MRDIDWDEYRDICHNAAVKSGWWSDLETGEKLVKDWKTSILLIHSEVSEGFEGYRKGNKMDDHLPHVTMLEAELADVCIRICDTAGGLI